MSMKPKAVPLAYSAPIVTKAMRVLKMIVTNPRNPGISEIASKLSLAKSTTHGILAALEEGGWVLRDPVTRRYTCGHAVKDLAARASVAIPLVERARSSLERLSAELDDDIFLGIFTSSQLLILDHIESSKELKVTTRPGTRISMFAGAAGKIFLAHFDREEIRAILRAQPLPRFTPISVTDPKMYLSQLDSIRKEGVAADKGEYIQNVGAVAAPIFYGKKSRKRMVAAFWVVGLDWHLIPGKMEKTKERAVRTSKELSKLISTDYGGAGLSNSHG